VNESRGQVKMMTTFWLRTAAVATVLLSLVFIGCSVSRTQGVASGAMSVDLAPGSIFVDVLEGGEPEHYWQYQVQPAAGASTMIREESFPTYKERNIPRTFSRPAGVVSCAQNPTADSPDGEYSAYCNGDGSDEFYIANRAMQTVQKWTPFKEIRGFAWAPNSKSIAILTASGHIGIGPRELLSFLSGHPVSHNTVFLDLLDVRSGKITEFVVRRDVVSAFTRILGWSA
jgi:hypothetical protein